MSVRKISELPYLNIENENDENLSAKLGKSLIEISFPQAVDNTGNAYQFVSRSISYKDMVTSLGENVLGSQNTYPKLDAWSPILFNNGISVLHDCNVENLTLNGGNAVLKPGQFDIETTGGGDINIQSQTTVKISAPNISLYAGGTDPIAEFTEAGVTISNLIESDVKSFDKINSQSIYSVGISANIISSTNLTVENVIMGTALKAKWADLAECYESDKMYEPGTFVKFGGEKEITIASKGEVNAVITTNPGFILGENSQKQGIIQKIALVGRTPVKVMGSVKKFDKLIMSDVPGIAKKANKNTGITDNVIAIALENVDSDDISINLVESVVQLKL